MQLRKLFIVSRIFISLYILSDEQRILTVKMYVRLFLLSNWILQPESWLKCSITFKYTFFQAFIFIRIIALYKYIYTKHTLCIILQNKNIVECVKKIMDMKLATKEPFTDDTFHCVGIHCIWFCKRAAAAVVYGSNFTEHHPGIVKRAN